MKPHDLPETPDPTWDLLRHSPARPVPSPFAGRVLAAARAQAQESAVVAFPMRRWAAGLSAAAAIVIGLWSNLPMPPVEPSIVVQTTSELPSQSMDDGSVMQELAAVQTMHDLITVTDPRELNDAQLFAFLN